MSATGSVVLECVEHTLRRDRGVRGHRDQARPNTAETPVCAWGPRYNFRLSPSLIQTSTFPSLRLNRMASRSEFLPVSPRSRVRGCRDALAPFSSGGGTNTTPAREPYPFHQVYSPPKRPSPSHIPLVFVVIHHTRRGFSWRRAILHLQQD